MANTYQTSTGERVAKQTIDARVRKAKEQKISKHLLEYGYLFCEECGKNEQSSGKLDCSHEISVDKAQKEGMSELAWDVDNIKLRCRACHQKHDMNGIG